MSDTPTSIYSGLSQKARLWVLALGAAIAVLNLGAAWYFSHETSQSLRLSSADLAPFKEWLAGQGHESLSPEARYDLSARALHIVAYSKAIANKQGLVLACFGAAFALGAIGFSLFVIGADGAFKASAGTSDKAKLVLSGTAPGLLCFVIGGLLVNQGIVQKTQLELPPLMGGTVWSVGGSVPSTEDPCARTDVLNNCYTVAEWEKKFGQPNQEKAK